MCTDTVVIDKCTSKNNTSSTTSQQCQKRIVRSNHTLFTFALSGAQRSNDDIHIMNLPKQRIECILLLLLTIVISSQCTTALSRFTATLAGLAAASTLSALAGLAAAALSRFATAADVNVMVVIAHSSIVFVVIIVNHFGTAVSIISVSIVIVMMVTIIVVVTA